MNAKSKLQLIQYFVLMKLEFPHCNSHFLFQVTTIPAPASTARASPGAWRASTAPRRVANARSTATSRTRDNSPSSAVRYWCSVLPDGKICATPPFSTPVQSKERKRSDFAAQRRRAIVPQARRAKHMQSKILAIAIWQPCWRSQCTASL